MIGFKSSVIIALLFICTLATAQVDLVVTVTNVSSSKGNILVGLYNSKETFLKKKYQLGRATANVGGVEVRLFNIPAGDYAVAVLHDENSDDELNSNFYGKPVEGFGFSNNARAFLSAPSYEKALFKVTQSPTRIAIKLKYL